MNNSRFRHSVFKDRDQKMKQVNARDKLWRESNNENEVNKIMKIGNIDIDCQQKSIRSRNKKLLILSILVFVGLMSFVAWTIFQDQKLNRVQQQTNNNQQTTPESSIQNHNQISSSHLQAHPPYHFRKKYF